MKNSAYTPFSAFDVMIRDFFDTNGDYLALTQHKSGHPVDIYEDKDVLLIEIACTGIDKKDVELTVEGDILRVKYEKKEQPVTDRKYIQRNIARRSFNLGYRLASRYNLAQSKATFNNGLLEIQIPLAGEAKPKKVEIE